MLSSIGLSITPAEQYRLWHYYRPPVLDVALPLLISIGLGITIVDISNLDNVRYCFVDFMGMESERVSLLTAVTPHSLTRYRRLNL